MKKEDILDLYDAAYASAYNDRFIFDAQYRHVADFELEILRKLVPAAGKWLDVGCGTGYFLSKFPGKQRAGIDLSPAMLAEAKKVNPDAMFLREQDFREPVPEWEDRWDLVTCMWCAYCYVQSMTEIDRVFHNLATWTAPGGACFIPLCDLEDVTYGRRDLVYYNPDIEIFGGPLYVNGVIWTYVDEQHGKEHKYLISPHREHIIRLLQAHFESVEVIYYPAYPPPIPGQRKGLLATHKRTTSSTQTMSVSITAAVAEITALSQANFAAPYDADAAGLSAPGVPAPRLQPSVPTAAPSRTSHNAWLRRGWHKLPLSLRKSIKRLIGEGG